jgi:hypothetical protein
MTLTSTDYNKTMKKSYTGSQSSLNQSIIANGGTFSSQNSLNSSHSSSNTIQSTGDNVQNKQSDFEYKSQTLKRSICYNKKIK